ncbi:Acyl-CoA synthetase [Phaffia rhodozyma]|uniref:Acyl-CoA synthetase n=1 Tax=Phaffia rhodozyma TaxID=264483 RepID=A0A0F7SYE8_PHARH|nr:Acyl-CoA synthetase [Phaffia rhodozyma]
MAPRKGNENGSWELDPDLTPSKGETKTRRSYCVKDLVTQPLPGINTTLDVVNYAAQKSPNARGFGIRPVLDTITETKQITKMVDGQPHVESKDWKFFRLGEYQWITYLEFKQRINKIGTGLYELGLGKRENGESGFVNIYSMTCLHWQMMAQACASISAPICTAYDTLGPDGLSHALSETSSQAVFTNADLLPTLLKVIKNCPDLRTVIYDGEPSNQVLTSFQELKNVRLISLEEVEELGSKRETVEIPPKRDDICCVMYTSGSTGTPKGVVLSHGNIISSVGAVYTLLYEILSIGDVYLAYLPLAHILELVVEISWIFVGMPIGYGRVKTLTDASVRQCRGDIAELKPTIMTGVPAVWETIRKGVNAKVAAGSTLTQYAFNFAYNLKFFAQKYGIPILPQLADTVVFNKVKSQTGGRLRFVLSGGAAISRSTQEFLTTTLVTTLQGYGLTETVGMCCVLPPDFFRYGVAGVPVPSMELKLVDVPEAGYLATNSPPQGEIYCRGPSLFQGYFKRPDLDQEAFSDGPDGRWFKTGDVGQFNSDGTVSIVDRVKNLVKLAGGEYIALEKLESIYKSNQLVGNMCVFASTEARQPIAVVLVHEANLKPFLASKNLATPDAPLAQVIEDSKVQKAVLADINSTGKKAGLNSMETLQAVVLTLDEWTPESGLLTAAQKIQRKPIEKKYESDIKKAYAV